MSRRVDTSDTLAYRIHRTNRLLRRHLARTAAGGGLDVSPEQWFVLDRLRQQDGRSQVELTEAIFADRPNLTRLLGRLEAKGLVRREPDPEDKRRMRVFLTQSGRDLHDRFAALVHGVGDDVLSGVSPTELDAALAVLERIDRNLGFEPCPTQGRLVSDGTVAVDG